LISGRVAKDAPGIAAAYAKTHQQFSGAKVE